MPECPPDGVCASTPPALATVAGRTVLVGTPYALEDLVAAVARGELPPDLSEAQRRLVEAYAERG